MPRPGPRPYECIRRAWHLDTHESLRASLINEIFRIAAEIHSSKTRQNKEWQQKLPYVVVRAEEILYSKANSEAEYMDLKTLKDRVEDAVNTMIRRDETTEQGQYLKPCVEAALYLGCHPKKSSRGQRHNSRNTIIAKYHEHSESPPMTEVKYKRAPMISAVPEVKYNKANMISQDEQCQIGLSYPKSSSAPNSKAGNINLECVNDAVFYASQQGSVVNTISRTLNTSRCPFAIENPQVLNIAPKEQTLQNSNLQIADHQIPFSRPMPSSVVSSSFSNPWIVPASYYQGIPQVVYPSLVQGQDCAKENPPVDVELHSQCQSTTSKKPSQKESHSQCLVSTTKNDCSVHPNGENPEEHSLDECFRAVDITSKAFEVASTTMSKQSLQKECKQSDGNTCDLHLRLGPSSCFTIAMARCSDVEDLESSSSRTKASSDDLESFKVNDSFISGSCESTQDVFALSPSHNLCLDVQESHLKESKDTVLNQHLIRTDDYAELPSKKCRKYNQKMVKDNISKSAAQDDILDLQIGLGLPLYRS